MIHHHVYRARLAIVASLVFALVVIVAEFPLSMLLRQRQQIAVVAAQLGSVTSRNAALRGDISALSHDQTIGEIAHEEYGLVQPGQLAYVILPGAGSPNSNGLGVSVIAPRDLVASVEAVTPSPRPAAGHGPGLWHRFVQHLEFWRADG